MTGLRVRGWIDRRRFRAWHGVGILDQFSEALRPGVEAGLLVVNDIAVRLTRRGVLMSSEILSAVV